MDVYIVLRHCNIALTCIPASVGAQMVSGVMGDSGTRSLFPASSLLRNLHASFPHITHRWLAAGLGFVGSNKSIFKARLVIFPTFFVLAASQPLLLPVSVSVYIVCMSQRRRAPPEANSADVCYKIALHVHLFADMSPCNLVANPSQHGIGWLRSNDRWQLSTILNAALTYWMSFGNIVCLDFSVTAQWNAMSKPLLCQNIPSL